MFSLGIWWRQGTALAHQETPSSYKQRLACTEEASEQGELRRDPQTHIAPFPQEAGGKDTCLTEQLCPWLVPSLWLVAAVKQPPA